MHPRLWRRCGQLVLTVHRPDEHAGPHVLRTAHDALPPSDVEAVGCGAGRQEVIRAQRQRLRNAAE